MILPKGRRRGAGRQPPRPTSGQVTDARPSGIVVGARVLWTITRTSSGRNIVEQIPANVISVDGAVIMLSAVGYPDPVSATADQIRTIGSHSLRYTAWRDTPL